MAGGRVAGADALNADVSGRRLHSLDAWHWLAVSTGVWLLHVVDASSVPRAALPDDEGLTAKRCVC